MTTLDIILASVIISTSISIIVAFILYFKAIRYTNMVEAKFLEFKYNKDK
jgi:hypothetical protein